MRFWPAAVSAFALWKRWVKRRHYENIGLFPPPLETPKGYLNLWVGFAVQPVPGDWSLLRNHIKDAVCGGDEVNFTWVMDWLAQLREFESCGGVAYSAE